MTSSDILDTPLRATGDFEKWFISRHHLKFYNTVAVTATYNVPRSQFSENESIESLIYRCLHDVVSKHPILGVTVTDEGTAEPKWLRLERIDLSRVVKVVQHDSTSNLDKIIEDGHQLEFDSLKTLPLWHVVAIVQNTKLDANQDIVTFTIGYFFHHAIGDGTSGAAFHRSFLDALNGSNTKVTGPMPFDHRVVSIPEVPLLPTIEMKCKFPLSTLFTLKKLFNAFVYTAEDPLQWLGPLISSTPPEKPPIVKVKSFVLSHELVQKLVAKCRSESSTVTSLLSVLLARKLAVMYPTHSRFGGNIPFDLRKFSGHTDRDMGCFVSNVIPMFSSEAKTPRGYISCTSDASTPVSQDPRLWESARACKVFMAAGASTTTDQSVGLLKFIKNDYASYFLGLLGKKRDVAFELTNIMVVDGGAGVNDRSKATFDRIIFSASVPTYGYPYCLLLATAKNGSMTPTLCWEEGVMENAEALELSAWLETSIRTVIGA